MCRLLGYATDGRNISLTQAIGSREVEAFRRLSVIHNDGWGASLLATAARKPHVHDGGAPTAPDSARLYRSTQPARLDPLYDVLTGQASRGALFHLRLASSNLPLIMENQQPFFGEGLSFIHNGDISDDHGVNIVHNPDYAVNSETTRNQVGRSDSAIFFATVLRRYDEGRGLPQAVADAVAELRLVYPKSSYNCMVQSPDQLVCLRASGRVATSPRIVEVYARYGQAERARNYRSLWYKVLRPDMQGALGVAVASSGFQESEATGWRELDNNQMLVASNHTGQYSIREL